MMIALFCGCGRSSPAVIEKGVVEKQIEVLEQWANLLEQVSDKKSYEAAQPVVASLAAKLNKLNDEFNALPEDRKAAAVEPYVAKMQQAAARLSEAKAKAVKAAAAK